LHQHAIEQLGGTPEIRLEPPIAKSTKENLEASIGIEPYERKLCIQNSSSKLGEIAAMPRSRHSSMLNADKNYIENFLPMLSRSCK